MQKVFINQYSIWKKTFKTIHQLSCFVGHPVDKNNDHKYRLPVKTLHLSKDKIVQLYCILLFQIHCNLKLLSVFGK